MVLVNSLLFIDIHRFYSGATAVAIIRGGDVEPDDERYVIPERERANLP